MAEIEGFPGTWSHCGVKVNHKPHRHVVIFNEGPYHNILCLGTPGDFHGERDTPPIRPTYIYPEIEVI